MVNKNEWAYLRRSLISLTILFASIRSSKAFGTFLMATFCPFSLLFAEQTTPYAPCPICLINSYFSSTTKIVPDRLRVKLSEKMNKGTCTFEGVLAFRNNELLLF